MGRGKEYRGWGRKSRGRQRVNCEREGRGGGTEKDRGRQRDGIGGGNAQSHRLYTIEFTCTHKCTFCARMRVRAHTHTHTQRDNKPEAQMANKKCLSRRGHARTLQVRQTGVNRCRVCVYVCVCVCLCEYVCVCVCVCESECGVRAGGEGPTCNCPPTHWWGRR